MHVRAMSNGLFQYLSHCTIWISRFLCVFYLVVLLVLRSGVHRSVLHAFSCSAVALGGLEHFLPGAVCWHEHHNEAWFPTSLSNGFFSCWWQTTFNSPNVDALWGWISLAILHMHIFGDHPLPEFNHFLLHSGSQIHLRPLWNLVSLISLKINPWGVLWYLTLKISKMNPLFFLTIPEPILISVFLLTVTNTVTHPRHLT